MPTYLLWPITLALLAAYALTDFRRQKGRLTGRIQKAKALGCPITPEEFEGAMAVPEAENAAPVYARLQAEIDAMEKEHPESLALLRETELRQEAANEKLKLAVEHARPVIDLLEEASAFPSYRVNRLADPSNETLEDKTAPAIRLAAKALIADILLKAQGGDFDEAKRKMGVLRTVVEHSLYEQTVLSWLIRVSQATRYLQALNQLARMGCEQEGFLDWVEAQLEKAPGLSPLLPCVKSEAAHTLAYGEMLKRTDFKKIFPGMISPPLSWSYFQSPAAIDAYISRGLEGLLNAIGSWPEDESDWVKVGAAYQPKRSAPWWVTPSVVWHFGATNAASAIPAYQTTLRLSKTGLWLLRQKLTLGYLPTHLGLFGQEGRSALNGAPFVYQTDGAHFELKSGQMRY